jgi:nucleoside-diphosphate-sugar epimerase
MTWTDKRVIVVGGAGFVGSNLCRKLLETDVAEILVIDNLLSAERENIPESKRVVFRKGSIADDAVLNQIDDVYDYIFHLATYHGNQSSIHDPIADHDNNLLTTLKLFDRIKDYKKIKKAVYAGAGCAVAEKTFEDAKPTSEDAPVSLEMDSPYSISKIVGEFYAVYYHRQHQLPTVRARFQNVYGPGEVLGAGKWRGTPATVWRNVTPTFIYKAIKQESLPLENEGLATRDFIFVDDIVRGLMLCAEKGRPGEVYNLANGTETRIKELARLINRFTENPTLPTIKPKRDWDRSGCRFGSTQKAKNELGFSADVELSDGLQKTIEWTLANLDFIEMMINKHRSKLDNI